MGPSRACLRIGQWVTREIFIGRAPISSLFTPTASLICLWCWVLYAAYKFEDMLRCVLFLQFALLVVAHNARIIGRDASLSSSYDFVIIGGGTSGLTVADRLTENPNSLFLLLNCQLRLQLLTCSPKQRPSWLLNMALSITTKTQSSCLVFST